MTTTSKVELWGKNLFDYLYKIYTKEARYCVIFVSEEYNSKVWTNHERQAAQERAIKEKGSEYLLPINFGEAKMQGLPSTIHYIDAAKGVEKNCRVVVTQNKQTGVKINICNVKQCIKRIYNDFI